MPGHPCTSEAEAATDSADVPVDGHGHQFGRGVDQPDYASPPAFRLVWYDALHAPVTRRTTFYGFHPQLVSIQPGDEARRSRSAPIAGGLRRRDPPQEPDRRQPGVGGPQDEFGPPIWSGFGKTTGSRIPQDRRSPTSEGYGSGGRRAPAPPRRGTGGSRSAPRWLPVSRPEPPAPEYRR